MFIMLAFTFNIDLYNYNKWKNEKTNIYKCRLCGRWGQRSC